MLSKNLNTGINLKTKTIRANDTNLGNKIRFRYFLKSTLQQSTKTLIFWIIIYHTPETKVPCLPLSIILVAFHISGSLNTKIQAGSEKKHTSFIQSFYFPNAPIWIKSIIQRLRNV